MFERYFNVEEGHFEPLNILNATKTCNLSVKQMYMQRFEQVCLYKINMNIILWYHRKREIGPKSDPWRRFALNAMTPNDWPLIKTFKKLPFRKDFII